MRVLYVNPNTSVAITDRIVETAREFAAAGTEVFGITAHSGVPYVSSRAEALIAGTVTLEILSEHQDDFDAAVIAAFGDPGLGGARELFSIPVVGLAEAGLLTACMLGRKFALVTFARQLVAMHEECVVWHGLRDRCAGLLCLDDAFASLETVRDEKEELLIGLAEKAVRDHNADVIVLAGSPLAGLAQRVAHRISVPVVDCVAASIKMAEVMAFLRFPKASAGTYRRPDAKQSIGLPNKLAAWLSHA